MKRLALFATVVGLASVGHSHTEMFFALTYVQRTIAVTSSTIEVSYDCRLSTPPLEAVMPVLDTDNSKTVETSETQHFWEGAIAYLEADMVVYTGRDQVKIQRREFAPSADGLACKIAVQAPLPQTEEDVHITLVDPAFLFPPLTGPTTYPPTKGKAIAPTAFVVEDKTSSSVVLESSPATVLTVRKASH